MIRFVIASHGTLAEGFYSALKIITGADCAVQTVCAFLDEQPVEELLGEVIASCPVQDELVVMTDINGGSVNQFFMKQLLMGKKFYLFSNASLALMLELVTCLSSPIEEEELVAIAERIQKQPLYMNGVAARLSAFEEDEA